MLVPDITTARSHKNEGFEPKVAFRVLGIGLGYQTAIINIRSWGIICTHYKFRRRSKTFNVEVSKGKDEMSSCV